MGHYFLDTLYLSCAFTLTSDKGGGGLYYQNSGICYFVVARLLSYQILTIILTIFMKNYFNIPEIKLVKNGNFENGWTNILSPPPSPKYK